MVARRLLTQDEVAGDLTITAPLRNQPKRLSLSIGQVWEYRCEEAWPSAAKYCVRRSAMAGLKIASP